MVDALRARLGGRLGRLSPRHLLWALFVLALAAYVLVLALQPTAAGRGGR